MSLNSIWRVGRAVGLTVMAAMSACHSPVYGFAGENKALADSLWERLAEMKNGEDSIEVLSNIYDVTPRYKRDPIGTLLINLATRMGDSESGLDMVRNMANYHMRKDSLLEVDMSNAMLFPNSDDRAETLTFIRMMQNQRALRFSTPAEKDEKLRSLLSELNRGEKGTIYDEIVRLHAICLFIADSTQADVLVEFMDRLGMAIDKLRPEAYALRNCFFVQSAIAYASVGQYERSMEADLKLLESIDALEKGDLGQGRQFRNYAPNRYIVYTRLLSNYPLLEDEEAETYYNAIKEMVASDAIVASNYKHSLLPEVYYAMYKEDYKHALEVLKQCIDMPANIQHRGRLLKLMIESAQKVGDKDALLESSVAYNKFLEEALQDGTREKSKELEIVYGINQMKADYQHDRQVLQGRHLRWAVFSAVGLFLLLLGMFLFWRHSRQLAQNLIVSNDALRAESDQLRLAQADLVKARDEAQSANRMKSDFIKNMSGEIAVPLHALNEYTNLIVDCGDAQVKPHLRHFADLALRNAELLTTIVNDIINLAEIDNDSLEVNMRKEPLTHMCMLAIDSVKHRLSPGVSISMIPDLKDVAVFVDAKRLIQILVQLLNNAAKFTHEGSITIGYKVDEARHKVRIMVTDTGMGVDSENAERIFERFVKLDRTSQGVGIGLSIARHLAELMGGNVELDCDYKDGARFVVTVELA